MLKDEISKLEKELEATEKQLGQAKVNFAQQTKTMEADAKQKVESLKCALEENTRKLEQEKVSEIVLSFLYVVGNQGTLCEFIYDSWIRDLDSERIHFHLWYKLRIIGVGENRHS